MCSQWIRSGLVTWPQMMPNFHSILSGTFWKKRWYLTQTKDCTDTNIKISPKTKNSYTEVQAKYSKGVVSAIKLT